MVALEKPYHREPIPGLTNVIVKRVLRRSLDMLDLKDAPFNADDRVAILAAFDQWEPERVYSACPFKDVLDAYPGSADITKLYDYHKVLDKHMSDDKEVNEWANNIITIISRELWPDPTKWWNG